MPSTLPKRTIKKTSKQPAMAVLAEAVLPAKNRSHHGLAAITVILVFLTAGCLAAVTLVSEKMKTVEVYAQDVAAQLGESQQRNSDLTDQLTTIKTLQALAKRAAMPAAAPPVDVVWATYSSSNITVQYPAGYIAVKATSAFPVLTLKGGNGRIEIFRMKDFPNGERPFGIKSADVTQADIDNYIPKELRSATNQADPKVVPYSVWVYYGSGDDAAKAVLDQAVASLKVTK